MNLRSLGCRSRVKITTPFRSYSPNMLQSCLSFTSEYSNSAWASVIKPVFEQVIKRRPSMGGKDMEVSPADRETLSQSGVWMLEWLSPFANALVWILTLCFSFLEHSAELGRKDTEF